MIKQNVFTMLFALLIFTSLGIDTTKLDNLLASQINKVSNSDKTNDTTKQDINSDKEDETQVKSNILVVYFSCTNTTKQLAEYASEILDADIYEIVPKSPYTDKDLAYYTNSRADQEQNDPNIRPDISGNVDNMDTYDTIILGYPIWHGQAPRIISTFLESYDFSKKTIIPFCTSHSSGIGSSATNLHSLCSNSTKWLEGKRFSSETSKETMREWFSDIKILN